MKKVYSLLIIGAFLSFVQVVSAQGLVQQTITWPNVILQNLDESGIVHLKTTDVVYLPMYTNEGQELYYEKAATTGAYKMIDWDATTKLMSLKSTRGKVVTLNVSAVGNDNFEAFETTLSLTVSPTLYAITAIQQVSVHLNMPKDKPTVVATFEDEKGNPIIVEGTWIDNTYLGQTVTSSEDICYENLVFQTSTLYEAMPDVGITLPLPKTCVTPDSKQVIRWNPQTTIKATKKIELPQLTDVGLPVSYSFVTNDGVAHFNSVYEVGFDKAGEVTIEANAAGNEIFEAADPVIRTFTVVKTNIISAFPTTTVYEIERHQSLSTIGLVHGTAIDEDGTTLTDGTWMFANPAIQPTYSGYYDVVYTPANTNIYNTYTTKVYVVVVEKKQILTWEPTEYLRTIDGPILLNATSNAVDAVIVYTATPSTGIVELSETEATILTSGNVTITANSAAIGEYAAAEPIECTFTIRKTNLTATLDETSFTLSAGSDLSSIALKGSVVDEEGTSVDGSFAFAPDAVAPAAGSASTYDVIFTPSTHVAWYNECVVSVTVTSTGLEQSLTWPLNSWIYAADKKVLPSITTVGGQPLTYIVDKPEIATVDAVTKSLDISKSGTIKITVSAPAGDGYCEFSATYNLRIDLTPYYLRSELRGTDIYLGQRWNESTLSAVVENALGEVIHVDWGFVDEVAAARPTTTVGDNQEIAVYAIPENAFLYKSMPEEDDDFYWYGFALINVLSNSSSWLVVTPSSGVTTAEGNYRCLLYTNINGNYANLDLSGQTVIIADKQYYLVSVQGNSWLHFTAPFNITNAYSIVVGDQGAFCDYLRTEIAENASADLLSIIDAYDGAKRTKIAAGSSGHYLLYEGGDTWLPDGENYKADWNKVTSMSQTKTHAMLYPNAWWNGKLVLLEGVGSQTLETTITKPIHSNGVVLSGNYTLADYTIQPDDDIWVYMTEATIGGTTYTNSYVDPTLTTPQITTVAPSQAFIYRPSAAKTQSAPRKAASADGTTMRAVGMTRDGVIIWKEVANTPTALPDVNGGAILMVTPDMAGFSLLSSITQDVAVYSVAGELVYQSVLPAAEQVHVSTVSGVYIVRTPNDVVKVVVR